MEVFENRAALDLIVFELREFPVSLEWTLLGDASQHEIPRASVRKIEISSLVEEDVKKSLLGFVRHNQRVSASMKLSLLDRMRLVYLASPRLTTSAGKMNFVRISSSVGDFLFMLRCSTQKMHDQ